MTISEKVSDFQKHLRKTNRSFTYYIDWSNIWYATKIYENEIHILDSLIRCNDHLFYEKFENILFFAPRVVEVFPYLFALSKNERKDVTNDAVLTISDDNFENNTYFEYSFNKEKLINAFKKNDHFPSDNISKDSDKYYRLKPIIEEYYNFFCKMGLKKLFENILEKSVMDYITGVLVGMDSNGRKNRGGKSFECACKPIISSLCVKYNLTLIEQRQFKYLNEYYSIPINNDIKNRKADFIIIDNLRRLYMNIEVNFFNSSGSKPEEIIDSYINRQTDLKNNNINFTLITDGDCWNSATNQLAKGIKKIKNIINFYMLVNGELEKIIKEEFGV